MISRADARAIIYHLDAATLARRAWREAVRSLAGEFSSEAEGAPFRMAAVVLDLADGSLRIESFRSWGGVELDENLVVLTHVDRVFAEDTERRFSEGCEISPSPEVIEESVVRAVEYDGVGVSWRAVETQLHFAYDFGPEYDPAGADKEPGDRLSWDGR